MTQGIREDLLDGMAAIADFTGLDEPRAYALANAGLLPCFKLGNKWYGRKSELDVALTARGRPTIKAPIAKRAVVEAAN
jgi:hypothetical protein